MKSLPGLLLIAIAVGLIAGCYRSPKSGRGFVFPEGEVSRGKAAFVELKCYTCHTVKGEEGIPPPTVEPAHVVVLGGEVSEMRTYGNLVTSVIHPSYKISDKVGVPRRWELTVSPMPVVNDTMTVRQMLDVVTFLQPHYRELEPIYHNQPYGP